MDNITEAQYGEMCNDVAGTGEFQVLERNGLREKHKILTFIVIVLPISQTFPSLLLQNQGC